MCGMYISWLELVMRSCIVMVKELFSCYISNIIPTCGLMHAVVCNGL
jgi:hypothetical protein